MSRFNSKKIITCKSDYYIDVIYRDIINLKNVSKDILKQALDDMYDRNRPSPYRYEQILSYFSSFESIKLFLKDRCYPIPSYDCSYINTKIGTVLCDDYYNYWTNIFTIIAIRCHDIEFGRINDCNSEDPWYNILSKHNKGFIKYCEKFNNIGTLTYRIDISNFPKAILLHDISIIEYLDDHDFNFNITLEFRYSIRLKDIENSPVSSMFDNIL